MKKVMVTALFLSLILVLAACGGSDESSEGTTDSGNDSGETTEQSTDDSTSDSDSSEATTTLDVTATDFEFNKGEYTVPSGEEVKVSLTSKEGTHGLKIKDTDVDIQGEGEATFTIDEPGEYTIRCSVPCGEGHSDMMSTLIVK